MKKLILFAFTLVALPVLAAPGGILNPKEGGHDFKVQGEYAGDRAGVQVIALGDGKMLESGERAAFQVKKGDVVLFASYAGTDVKVDGEEYLLMSEDDILAVID